MRARNLWLALAGALALAFAAHDVPAAGGLTVPLATPPSTFLTSAGWPGGAGTVAIYGTLGTATFQLAWSPDGGTTWINIGAAISALGLTTFTAPIGLIRLTLASGSGESVTANAYPTVTIIG